MNVRMIVGVLAGYAAWTVICLPGNALMFPEAGETIRRGEFYGEALPLVGSIALSVVCSLIAGLAAARVAGALGRRAAIGTAALLLLTGIGVQASTWSLMPVWFHLIFLALIVPFTVLGGRVATVRARA